MCDNNMELFFNFHNNSEFVLKIPDIICIVLFRLNRMIIVAEEAFDTAYKNRSSLDMYRRVYSFLNKFRHLSFKYFLLVAKLSRIISDSRKTIRFVVVSEIIFFIIQIGEQFR